jgi:dihydrofolate reductase
MGKIIVSEFITLDGVMQAPGDASEMERGGWNLPFMDTEAEAYKTDEALAAEVLLLGANTYKAFAAAWPHIQGDPLGDKLNSMPKYVVAPDFGEADLTWDNTVHIKDDVIEAVKKLKAQPSNVLVYGSAQLVQSLLQQDLVDEYHLQLHPIVVGMGKRLFDGGLDQKTFKLADYKATPSGLLLLTYVPSSEKE